MIRIPSVILIAMTVAFTDATACLGPIDMMTIFYDEVPQGIDASAIVQVTIVELPPTNDNHYFLGIGRVERVIKGEIDGATIRVLSPTGDCLNKFSIGSRGIVIGDIRKSSRGEVELLAIPESFSVRRNNRVFDSKR